MTLLVQGIKEKGWKNLLPILICILLCLGRIWLVMTPRTTPYLCFKFDAQKPVVYGDGNIIYQFPSLQRTAGRPNDKTVGGIEKFLVEKMWQFSRTNAGDRAAVIGLGGPNLFVVAIMF